MSLRLSSAEIVAIERAITVLLAPFSYEDFESWRRDSAHAVAECVGADASSFEICLPGLPLIAAEPDVMRALKAVDPPPDWVVEALTVRRRQLGLTVTDWEELFDANQIKRTYFYNEIVRPQGLLAPITMLKGLQESPIPAALSMYFSDERSAGRHVARRKELLRLVYPAYCAGLKVYLTFRNNAEALRSLAEHAAIGVMTFDSERRLASENESFQRLMSADPDRGRVRNEIARRVRAFLQLSPNNGNAPPLPAQSDFKTAAGHYRILTTLLDKPSPTQRGCVIALVERIGPALRDVTEIAGKFSLTPREVDCALLLSHGLSSRDMAQRLGISINTARRHVERIFLKLDVHNRLAAVAKLTAVSLLWLVTDLSDLVTTSALG